MAALTASPVWTAEANQAGARFGQSVAPAGDVNGDGFTDVIVGAEGYNHGAGQNGGAFVYHGSAAGLDTIPAWTSEGDSLSSGLGHAVAPAGDVNGDGYGDVIVSDWLYSNGETFEGRAFVYHGSASGLASTPAWAVEGDQFGAFFGASVATAGDVNGDGFADVIVGAYGFDNGQSDEGRAYVYHGSAAGLATTPAWTGEQNQAGSQYGISVATAGDVNGDGYDDVVVGADRWTNGQTQEGRLFFYRGSASGLLNGPTSIEMNFAFAHFGASVSTAGDTNGDGYADVIVGAPENSNGQVAEGRAFVFRGSSTGLTTVPAWSAESDQANAFFGQSVGAAGDVNGDGYADVIVGAYRYDNDESEEGRAYVYYGSNVGPTTPRWTSESNQINAEFGISAATAGDVNGDGYSDVIVGARYFSNGAAQEGRASVYHGAADGLAFYPGWGQESNQPTAFYGSVVAGVGDVNGDGYSDHLIGAYGYANGQFDEGRIFVHHGSASGPSFIENWTTESNQNFAFMGYVHGAAGSAGDVNGDGFGDLIVGAPYFDNGEPDEGRVSIHVGSPSGLLTSVYWLSESNEADAHYGISVASAGDVNGDGFGDVIVGAEQASNGESREGRAYVYHGSPTGLTLAWTAESDQVDAHFGRSVACAGDVNGDGYTDVIVGAPHYDAGNSDEGRAFVYLGSPSGIAGTPAWTAESNQNFAEYGNTVATAGDVNGDGYSDVIVGAHLFDGGQGNEGRAEIFFGSATGLAEMPAWTVESNQVIAGVGMVVASAGDVNGDGYSDVVIGYRQATNAAPAEGRAFLYQGGPAGPDVTPDWSAEGGQGSASFGSSVAAAGDVDGDGFSDVVVGAMAYDNGHSDEGYVFLYHGNLDQGLDRIPRQSPSTGLGPIALYGRSNSESSFRVKALGRTAAGRGDVRLQIEAKPFGMSFDGGALVSGPASDTGAPVGGSSAVGLNQLTSGLVPATPYHWRSRIASNSPYFPWSPWLSIPGNAPSEADLRTRDAFPRKIAIDDVSIVEGDAGTTQLVFTVAINPIPVFPVSVDYATQDGTAMVADGDYDATSGTLEIDAGQATAPIAVTVHGDLDFEFDETFTVELTNPQGATLINSSGRGTILDDADPSNIELCSEFPVTDLPVETIVERDGIVYIGGAFRQVGPPTGCALPLDVNTAAPLGIPRVEGRVYAVAPDGSGGWYVGGEFSQVAGVARSNLAHIQADHTASAWNPVADAPVHALAIAGGTVYAGGEFTNVGGQPRNHLAALDAATGSATSWNPDADATVEALAVSGGTVYAGGSFTEIGNSDHKCIAAIDAVTGQPTSWIAGSSGGTVRTIVASGGLIYVGGNFTFIGGEVRQHLAALDATDGFATPWDPAANHEVRALALGSGVLYAGGDFNTIGGEFRNRIAAIDLASGLATAWDPEMNSPVHALAVSGSIVYAGGGFALVGGEERRNLVALDVATGAPTAWNPRVYDDVRALAIDGSTLYAGGLFAGAGGEQRRGLAAIDAATGAITSWDPSVSGSTSIVNDLEVVGNVVYAGGNFTAVGGSTRNYIAAIDRTTGVATAWNPNANGTVGDVCADGGVIYAGGAFSAIGGSTRVAIAALDATTGSATSWNPNANQIVNAIVVVDGVVYAGGRFTSIGGQPRNRIAALDATTGLATAWDPDVDDVVSTLLAANGSILVGGDFGVIGGTTRLYAAALDPLTGVPTPWNPEASWVVQAFGFGDGVIYAGGGFGSIGGQSLGRLAALDLANGAAIPWAPEPGGEEPFVNVGAIATTGTGSVYVGGSFLSIGGLVRSNIACIRSIHDVVGVPATPTFGSLELRLSPNPATGPARIEYTLPQPGHVRINVYDVRGRLVARPVDEARAVGRPATVWNAEGTNGRVAPGIYFVHIEAAGRSATQRLVWLR